MPAQTAAAPSTAEPIYAQIGEVDYNIELSSNDVRSMFPDIIEAIDQIEAEIETLRDQETELYVREVALWDQIAELEENMYAAEAMGRPIDTDTFAQHTEVSAELLKLMAQKAPLEPRLNELYDERLIYEDLLSNWEYGYSEYQRRRGRLTGGYSGNAFGSGNADAAAEIGGPMPVPPPPPPPPLETPIEDRLTDSAEVGGALPDPDFDWSQFEGAGDGGGGPGASSGMGGGEDWGVPDGAEASVIEPVMDFDLSELEPAAGGTAFGEACGRNERGDLICAAGQPEICDLEWPEDDTLRLVCSARSGDLIQADVPATDNVAQTMLSIARELAGPNWEAWGPDVELCLRDPKLIEAMPTEETGLLRPCHFSDWPRLSRGLEAQAETGVPFDSGRIGYHAPKRMVVGQPYLLELAIVPIAGGASEAELDVQITEAVGPGTLQTGADALSLNFVSSRAAERMSADLIGTQFEISGTTPREQLLAVDETTVWQWLVTPQAEGQGLLNFSVSEIRTSSGVDIERSVRRLPILVELNTIESLLAEPDDAAPSGAPIMATMMADPRPEANPGLPDAVPGCTDLVGSDSARRALLLTNASYETPLSSLSETHPDGDRMGAALNAVGFGVRHCRDLNRRDAMRELRSFGRGLKAMTDAGVETASVFYYSGHGANVSGTNYILPTDLDGASHYDIEDGGVEFEDIFNRLSGAVATTSIVIFDACRTVMDDESRGIVATYRPVEWAQGVIQAFATSAGDVAFDSGLYSTSLAAKIEELDQPANMVFRAVQSEIYSQTAGRQSPVYSDATVGEPFYFRGD